MIHRPVYSAALLEWADHSPGGKLSAAWEPLFLGRVDLVLSGHIHTFQALGYQSDLPVQIVAGHGGDELHTTAPSIVAGLTINGEKVASGLGVSGVFGFAMLERAGADWRLTNRDMTGTTLATCLVRGRSLACD